MPRKKFYNVVFGENKELKCGAYVKVKGKKKWLKIVSINESLKSLFNEKNETEIFLNLLDDKKNTFYHNIHYKDIVAYHHDETKIEKKKPELKLEDKKVSKKTKTKKAKLETETKNDILKVNDPKPKHTKKLTKKKTSTTKTKSTKTKKEDTKKETFVVTKKSKKSSKKTVIMNKLKDYKKDLSADEIKELAKETNSTVRYVRMVLKELKNEK